MPRFTLTSVPDELLQDILQYDCPVETWLCVALTCRRLAQQLNERIFWISALKTTKKLRPIACPFHYELASCTLGELRDIALRTIRVRRNWSVPEPKPIAFKTIRAQGMTGDTHDIIFQIPGTQLYLLHDRMRAQLAVWDLGRGRKVSGTLSDVPHVADVSPGIDEPGSYSMGLLLHGEGDQPQELAMVCVRYGNSGESASLSIPIRQPLPSPETPHPGYWDIFATAAIVGVMTGPLDVEPGAPFENLMCILAFNIASAARTLIETDLDLGTLFESGGGDTATTVSGGDLFFLYEDGQKSLACRIPESLLPTKSTEAYPEKVRFKCVKNCKYFESNIGMTNDPSKFYGTSSPQGILTTGSYYGAPALSIRKHTSIVPTEDVAPGQPYVVRDDRDGVTKKFCLEDKLEVRFWAAGQGDYHDAEPGLHDGEGVRHEPYHTLTPHPSPHISGTIFERDDAAWRLILMTPSGRVMAAVVKPQFQVRTDEQSAESSPVLRLVRFNLERKTSSVHALGLPDGVSLEHIREFAVDDHCGVITLQGDSGSWFIISYA